MATIPAQADDRVSRLALRLIAANARLTALAMVSALALIVLGVWMYVGVKDSLREMRATGLQSVLDAEVEALEVWMNDRRALVSAWADEPEVRRDVESLLEVARVARPDDLW